MGKVTTDDSMSSKTRDARSGAGNETSTHNDDDLTDILQDRVTSMQKNNDKLRKRIDNPPRAVVSDGDSSDPNNEDNDNSDNNNSDNNNNNNNDDDDTLQSLGLTPMAPRHSIQIAAAPAESLLGDNQNKNEIAVRSAKKEEPEFVDDDYKESEYYDIGGMWSIIFVIVMYFCRGYAFCLCLSAFW